MGIEGIEHITGRVTDDNPVNEVPVPERPSEQEIEDSRQSELQAARDLHDRARKGADVNE